MQIKIQQLIKWLGIAAVAAGGMLFLLVYPMLMTSLPVTLISQVLNLQGQEVQDMRMLVHSFKDRDFHIGRLHLKDEIKDLEIQNFDLRTRNGQVKTIYADLLSFRDLTRPNLSLEGLLEKIAPDAETSSKRGSSFCVERIHIKNLSIALSYSAQPWRISEFIATDLCPEAEGFKVSSIQWNSEDIKQSGKTVLWRVDHQHFYDLTKEIFIPLPFDGQRMDLGQLPFNEIRKNIR